MAVDTPKAFAKHLLGIAPKIEAEGLSLSQLVFLTHLFVEKRQTVSQLAAFLNIEDRLVEQRIERLMARDLISVVTVRASSKNPNRPTQYGLTRKGAALFNQVPA